MTVFDEIRFPLKTTHGSSGGPRRRTEIATLGSGAEERNAVWADSRREYAAGSLVKNRDDLHAVIAFFEARNAQLRAFRFRDPIDYRSGPPLKLPSPVDQVIGLGNGTLATFQLVKIYSSGSQSWTRAIKKPVAGSVRVAVNAVEKIAGTDFTVDTATGVVTFLPGHIPGPALQVTAGFEFDVPVRFNTDFLNFDLAAFAEGQIPDIPLIEVKI